MNIVPFSPEFNGEEPTMSSREIADLLEKRHDKVKQSIERLAESGVIVQPPMGAEQDTDTMGRKRTTSVYHIGKRDTYVIVAQLSPEFTARLVDRWQELEQQALGIPKNYPEALRLAAEQAEQISDMRPKAAGFDLLQGSDGSVTGRVAAKSLNVPEKRFFQWLYANNWAFKQGKIWQGYSAKIKLGYLEHKTHTFTVRETGDERTTVQMLITPRGMARLSQIFAKVPA